MRATRPTTGVAAFTALSILSGLIWPGVVGEGNVTVVSNLTALTNMTALSTIPTSLKVMTASTPSTATSVKLPMSTFSTNVSMNTTTIAMSSTTFITSTTTTTTTTTTAPPPNSAAEEKQSSMKLFFILLVIAFCILVTHILLVTKFHYLPESVAVVIVGAVIGLILKALGNWESAESFPPTVFFLVILPPIIFESGYNLHKGNFFANIGTILVFAILGTIISAVVVGGGIFLLGMAEVAYPLTVVESFAFGSLISAIDPVATLAIFHALDVEPVLYMLVFGESVLNDAVSIVLTTTVIEMGSPAMAGVSGASLFIQGVGRFCLMFFASSAIGVMFGLLSALMLKHVDLRRTPSLEIGMILIFAYLPYGLAEGLQLSGIMAILFTGIVTSHYTHQNLSPITQITVQQTFRTISFMAETCVFAYLGLAVASFSHTVKVPFVIWSIVLCLIGRAVNIFPLAFLVNHFREHKITRKMQFIMWFSGLRGAIAFALSLHLESFDEEKKQVVKTTTLIIVLFTILILGGSTLPILKFVNRGPKKKTLAERKKEVREITLSKTREMGKTIDSDHLSTAAMTTEEDEQFTIKQHHKGFVKVDQRYLVPFFTRKLTPQEMRDGQKQISSLTDQWYKEMRSHARHSDSSSHGNDLSHSRGAGRGSQSRRRATNGGFSRDEEDEEETEILFERGVTSTTVLSGGGSSQITNETARTNGGSSQITNETARNNGDNNNTNTSDGTQYQGSMTLSLSSAVTTHINHGRSTDPVTTASSIVRKPGRLIDKTKHHVRVVSPQGDPVETLRLLPPPSSKRGGRPRVDSTPSLTHHVSAHESSGAEDGEYLYDGNGPVGSAERQSLL